MLYGTGKTEREQDEICLYHSFRAGDGLELRRRADANGVQLFYIAVFVARELHRVERPIALAALFMRALGAQLQGPQRPGSAGRALQGRHGHDLKLVDGLGLMAVAGAQAIRAGIAAADDYDALAGGANLIRNRVAGDHFILLRQELHGEIDALELAAGNVEVAWGFRAAGQQQGVKFLAQILRGNAAAHVSARLEADSLGHHLFQAPVEHALFQLEVGNAVAQQAADAVVFFKYGDVVPGAIQLLRGGQARRAGAHHGNALAGAGLGNLRLDPALFPGAVHYAFFN